MGQLDTLTAGMMNSMKSDSSMISTRFEKKYSHEFDSQNNSDIFTEEDKMKNLIKIYGEVDGPKDLKQFLVY